MSYKKPAIAVAAAALFAVVGSASVSAQENCGFIYQQVMQAYQAQAPQYTQMLDQYNARCLAGSSSQPGWEGEGHRQFDNGGYGYSRGRYRWGG